MTPTSATGSDRRSCRGFTLIELMVVLFVVGLVGGVVLLTARPPAPALGEEADVLAARLTQAKQEAILVNRAVEMALVDDGYLFRELRAGEWRDLEDGPLGRAAWSPGLKADIQALDGRRNIRFDPTGLASPAVVSLSLEDRSARVAVDEAGNVRVHAPG